MTAAARVRRPLRTGKIHSHFPAEYRPRPGSKRCSLVRATSPTTTSVAKSTRSGYPRISAGERDPSWPLATRQRWCHSAHPINMGRIRCANQVQVNGLARLRARPRARVGNSVVDSEPPASTAPNNTVAASRRANPLASRSSPSSTAPATRRPVASPVASQWAAMASRPVFRSRARTKAGPSGGSVVRMTAGMTALRPPLPIAGLVAH